MTSPGKQRGKRSGNGKKRTNDSPNQQEVKRDKRNSAVAPSSTPQDASNISGNAQGSNTEVPKDIFPIHKLPDLPLIGVLKHLERLDLEMFSRTDRKNRNFVRNEATLNKIKFTGYGRDLMIYQTRRGYGFRMQAHSVLNREYSFDILEYEIEKEKNGRISEKKSISPMPKYKRPGKYCTGKKAPSWPVPNRFITELFEMIRIRNVTKFIALEFPMDPHFFGKLADELKNHSCKEAVIIPIRNEIISEEGRINVARALSTMHHVQLPYSYSLITNSFLKALQPEKLPFFEAPDDWYSPDYEDDKKPLLSDYFDLNEDTLPFLIGYQELKVETMILQVQWVIKLFKLQIAHLKNTSRTTDTCLQFSTDRPLTSQMIIEGIRGSGFLYLLERGRYSTTRHELENNADNIRAVFELEDSEVEGKTIHGVKINVYMPKDSVSDSNSNSVSDSDDNEE